MRRKKKKEKNGLDSYRHLDRRLDLPGFGAVRRTSKLLSLSLSSVHTLRVYRVIIDAKKHAVYLDPRLALAASESIDG